MLALGLGLHKNNIPQKVLIKNGLVMYLDGRDFKNNPPTTSWKDRSGNNNNATPTNFNYVSSLPSFITTDYTGKIAGSLVESPHLYKRGYNNALIPPSDVAFGECAQVSYDAIKTLNGSSDNKTSANVAGSIPQFLLQLNVVSSIEKTYGKPIPTINGTLAEKITWIKANVSLLTLNAFICGANPTGNKAYVDYWDVTANNYAFKSANLQDTYKNTTSSPSNVSVGTANITNKIDDNGILSAIVYTDSARTTDANLIVLTGHGLVSNDIIENTTGKNVAVNITTNTVNTNVLACSTAIVGQVAGDNIDKFHNTGVSKLAETGTTSTVIKITNHGLSNTHAHYIKNGNRGYVLAKVTVTDANTLTLYTSIANQVAGDNILFYPYSGSQLAESTIIPSTISVDYVSLQISFVDTSSGSDENGGVVYDSIDDVCIIPYSSSMLLLGNDFTLGVKAKFKAIQTGYNYMFSSRRTSISSNYEHTFYYSQSTANIVFSYTLDGSTTLNLYFPFTPSVGVEYNITLKRVGNVMYCYVNGNQVGAPSAITGSLFASTANLAIGASFNGAYGNLFNGTMKRIFLYNRALSISEILKNNAV